MSYTPPPSPPGMRVRRYPEHDWVAALVLPLVIAALPLLALLWYLLHLPPTTASCSLVLIGHAFIPVCN